MTGSSDAVKTLGMSGSGSNGLNPHAIASASYRTLGPIGRAVTVTSIRSSMTIWDRWTVNAIERGACALRLIPNSTSATTTAMSATTPTNPATPSHQGSDSHLMNESHGVLTPAIVGGAR